MQNDINEANEKKPKDEEPIPQIRDIPVKLVWASRGKATRAEPISAIAEQGRDHHVGELPELEDEQCLWQPGAPSPNRLDAKVWALTELSNVGVVQVVPNQFYT